MEGSVRGRLTRREGEEVEGHVCQGDDGQHAVVSVGLDEIVTGDGCGVDVVLSERAYEGLQDAAETRPLDRRLGRARTGSGSLTFPKTGRSTDPQVSAPQWTSPEAKSAVRIPATESREETELKDESGTRARRGGGGGGADTHRCSAG